ncbi:MAG: hypothetical protein SPE01_00185 [Candidatus Spyradocola sp.]|nr:hypothetical protein [Candidatus Spyradocola sp.]
MKRLLALICALGMVLAMNPLLTRFFGNEVALEGSQLAAQPPEGWLMLTRNEDVLAENAAQFDLTAQQAWDFLWGNDFYLVLYEPQTAAEMYVTAFPSDYARELGPLAQLDDAALAVAMDDVAEGYDGWALDSNVSAQTYGDLTYLAVTMHFGDGADRTGNRQLFTVVDGWEVYIDLYADGDLDEALVRDQNALASSLRTASAPAPADPARIRRIALAAAGVCLLGVILVQSVSLALCVFLARWGRDGE